MDDAFYLDFQKVPISNLEWETLVLSRAYRRSRNRQDHRLDTETGRGHRGGALPAIGPTNDGGRRATPPPEAREETFGAIAP